MAVKPVPSSDELAYKAAAEADFASGAARNDLGKVTDGSFPLNEKKSEATDTTGFIGVSSEYMNYSSDLLKPGVAEDGVEAIREKRYRDAVQTKVADVPAAAEVEQSQGVSTFETLGTALSGADLKAEVVEAPKLEDGFAAAAKSDAPAQPASSTTEDTGTTDGGEEGGSTAPATPKTPATPAK